MNDWRACAHLKYRINCFLFVISIIVRNGNKIHIDRLIASVLVQVWGISSIFFDFIRGNFSLVAHLIFFFIVFFYASYFIWPPIQQTRVFQFLVFHDFLVYFVFMAKFEKFNLFIIYRLKCRNWVPIEKNNRTVGGLILDFYRFFFFFKGKSNLFF